MTLKPVGLYREMYKPGRHQELPSIFDALTSGATGDRERIAQYMESSPGVLDVLDVVTDVLNNTDRIASASSLISDGEWIWRVDSVHYFGKYNLEIPEEFLEHVRMRNYVPPNDVTLSPEFESEMLEYF